MLDFKVLRGEAEQVLYDGNMKAINLSPTAQEILSIYFATPGQKFYVNELIRKTGCYPNSIQQALKSLEKQKILLPSRRGRFKLHTLNKSYKFLPEIEEILKKQIDKYGILEGQREANKRLEERWQKILNRAGSIPFVVEWLKGIRDETKMYTVYNQVFGWYNSVTGGVYYNIGELERSGVQLKRLFEEDPKFATMVLKEFKKACTELLGSARKTRKADLITQNKRQLYFLLKNYQSTLLKLIPFLAIPLAIETFIEQDIKQKLDIILEREDKGKLKEKYLEVLISPAFQDFEQQEEALKVAALLKKYGMSREVRGKIAQYAESYRYLPLEAHIGTPLTDGYFESEVRYLAQKFKYPLKEVPRLRRLEKERQEQIKKVFRELKAGKEFKNEVTLLQEYIFLRTYRIKMQSKANYFHLPLLYELTQRMELGEEEIKYLTYDEMLTWLKHGYGRKFGYSYGGLKKEITKRMTGWAVLMWRGKIKIITGVKNIIEAMERYKIVAPTPEMVKTIKGNPACRGRATGRVKIVRKLAELEKVEEGDILVAKMTTPDYMVAIHKVVAIVTDEGGVTCHAAIVSREFNLPCIVGTKNATQILSDNDLVEVDANEGVVRVIEAVEIDEDVKEVFGRTVYKGKVRGTVRIVLDASDFPKVCEGDILVAPQTTPEYLSSLYKVKGFIVDEESITSHAMLYAKALRLPAVIGTQFARHLLQDGETVELDATKGVVRRLGE